jgi:hypothetical protein
VSVAAVIGPVAGAGENNDSESNRELAAHSDVQRLIV